MVKSLYYGHVIYSDGNGDPWKYEEDGSKIEGTKPKCPKCGAFPTTKGHDPCIANLPGVLYACCGHGKEGAYVMFENGLIIEGRFRFIKSGKHPGDI